MSSGRLVRGRVRSMGMPDHVMEAADLLGLVGMSGSQT